MVAGGARVAAEQLAAAGIDTTGLVIENGSGLSRIERISAASLGEMLIVAWRRPWMPEYIAALPVAGVDGTARKRLAGSPANGQAHIKTGTLNGVRAIGGYLLDRHGRRHALVMMVNHPEAASTAAAQDALLEWLWAGGR
jgi:D-alanyl-D-alanine carboxypeptidase/D-alanyl-D-alanine-endopeptidase (penicillin-binding protein 4)